MSLFIPYRYTEDQISGPCRMPGLTTGPLPRCRVFQRIAPDGSRLTDLAEQAQMSKQSAGVLVDQLERFGYVRRVSDPADGHARSDRHRATWPACDRGSHGNTRRDPLTEWKTYLGTRNFTLLHQILDQLREITDPYAR